MNPSTPLLIDSPRSAPAIAQALDRLLAREGFGPGGSDPLRDALVHIAARYGEIVTQCLNAAPERHLQAFAALLGGQPRPAEAASVALSFKPAAGRGGAPVVVPMHTRVAGPPATGSGEPVVFETQADLELVRAEVVSALYADAGHRSLTDLHASPADTWPVTPALHIGLPAAFGVAGLQQLRVQLGAASPSAWACSWAVTGPKGAQPLIVERDTTAGLSHSGEVLLTAPPDWPASTVDGIESQWLTLQLRPPEGAADETLAPPRLSSLAVTSIAATPPQPLAAACQDGAPLDISKDAFPFSERPRFGSVFQLLSPAFGEPGAHVDIDIHLTNPANATAAPLPPVSLEGRPTVAWEISTASGFRALSARDGTHALTQDGTLRFTVPADVAPVTLAGQRGPWLRARLASGHYGLDTAAGGVAVPRAPAIKSLSVRSTLERGPLAAQWLVAQGALSFVRLDPALPAPADAFPSADVAGPALYLALAAAPGAPAGPAGVLKAGSTLHWHVCPAPAAPPLAVGDEPDAGAAAPVWQVLTASGWRDAALRDATAGLTRAGIVQLTLPAAPAAWPGSRFDPGGQWAWLRIVWPDQAGRPPERLTLNCVEARHTQRLRNEVVGSSNGRSDQVFHALRTPLIGDVQLQVRELLGEAEAGDLWVDWHETDDLTTADAAARVFTLDRGTGALRFGDGRHGRIPPLGANNIRLREYRTGGGAAGNVPVRSLAQLRSALPAVESVSNPAAAAGGIDADDPLRVRGHASAWLRHRDRAVCADDYADLAQRASPEVARAHCVAGRDLAATTADGQDAGGAVSVIVIPQGDAPAPQPGLALLASVKQYLDARRAPGGRLTVVGPRYARVQVQAAVVAEAGESPHAVAAACEQAVARFLHPLTGGADGRGWALNQRPHRSDLHALLAALDGVALVRGLRLALDAPAAPWLVCAGTIVIAPGEALK